MVIGRRENRLEIRKVSILSQNQGKYQSDYISHRSKNALTCQKSNQCYSCGKERDVKLKSGSVSYVLDNVRKKYVPNRYKIKMYKGEQ